MHPGSSPASQFPRWVTTTFCAAILSLSVALSYSNSLSGPFVLDDIPTIVDSASIHRMWPISTVLFDGDTTAYGRPLLNLTFALNYAYGKDSVTSYHIVNVIIHLLAGLAFFGVVRRTLERWPSAATPNPHATPIALFTSLLWLLHPLQTESVTYVVQRAESLVGLFYWLSLYCAIRALSSRKSLVWPIASVLSCLCGVASKEVIVSAPLAVVLYDLTFSGYPWRLLWIRRRRLYVSLFCTWIPLFFIVAVTQGRQNSTGTDLGVTSWEYLQTQCWAICRYLHLTFWPDSLVLDYGVGVVRELKEIVPGAVVIALMVLGSLVALRYHPWISLVGFFFFAVLSPSSSIIPIVTQTVAEHRMYLPLASLVILTVMAIWQGTLSLHRLICPKTMSPHVWIFPSGLLFLIAVIFGTLTYQRNSEYSDSYRLWQTNIDRWPESLRPYMLIASGYQEKEHDPETALLWYDRGIIGHQLVQQHRHGTQLVDLQLAGIVFGRGTVYSQLRRFEDALSDFNRAVELNPDITNAYFYRGMVLGQLGREKEALESLTEAIAREASPEPLFIRGEILSRMKRYEEAVADLSLALQMDPSNPFFYQSRGQTLTELGRYQEALRDCNRALELQPNFLKALMSRGGVFAALKLPEEAIREYSKVVALSPDYAEAYRQRSRAEVSLGRLEQARTDLDTYERLTNQSVPELRQQILEGLSGASGDQ